MIGQAHTTLLGTIVAEPEFINGHQLMKLRVAVNERTKDKETKASFFNVESWKENLNKSLSGISMAGKNVLIMGSPYEDTWEKDGRKFRDYPVRLDKFVFTDRKGDTKPQKDEDIGF